MNEYDACENDLRFAIQHSLEAQLRHKIFTHYDISDDIIDSVLSEAAKFSRDVLAPLNHSGDQQGCQWHSNYTVTTPDGFKAAHRAMGEAGWFAIEASEEYGGQQLSKILAAATMEMWNAANMSFALCGLLTQGQIHTLESYGNMMQKQIFLPPLVTGKWSGTMNLTEPQAGTDLAALKTSAQRDGEYYRLRGQKIFITYGEHDMCENIIHLVLARVQGAPEGINGISLFIVPKFLVNSDGSLGGRNDVKCVSIEHKLGINGSPTAVLQYGDEEGAIGYLIGKENQGLEIMFAMMNEARFGVGVQGLSVANRSYSQARAFAMTRIQGVPLDRKKGDSIVHHPDVMRLLSSMRAQIEAMRGLSIYTAAVLDLAKITQEPDWQARSALMIPILKGWLTEQSVKIASDAIQVHGGMGFIEETGIAQHYRDARILPIYEGTTAIQSNDLMFRKTLRDRGKAVFALINDIEIDAREIHRTYDELTSVCDSVLSACDTVKIVIKNLLEHHKDLRHAAAVSVPYLMMLGTLTGGWMVLRSAAAGVHLRGASDWSADFLHSKSALADVYMTQILPEITRFATSITKSGTDIEKMCIEYL